MWSHQQKYQFLSFDEWKSDDSKSEYVPLQNDNDDLDDIAAHDNTSFLKKYRYVHYGSKCKEFFVNHSWALKVLVAMYCELKQDDNTQVVDFEQWPWKAFKKGGKINCFWLQDRNKVPLGLFVGEQMG